MVQKEVMVSGQPLTTSDGIVKIQFQTAGLTQKRERLLTMKNKAFDSDNMPSIDYASPNDWDNARKAINLAVDNPPHYNKGAIETIDYIVDVLGDYDAIHYCHGNVLKYTGSRLWEKGKPIEDSRKAIWYLNKMVELMEKTKGVNW